MLAAFPWDRVIVPTILEGFFNFSASGALQQYVLTPMLSYPYRTEDAQVNFQSAERDSSKVVLCSRTAALSQELREVYAGSAALARGGRAGPARLGERGPGSLRCTESGAAAGPPEGTRPLCCAVLACGSLEQLGGGHGCCRCAGWGWLGHGSGPNPAKTR